MTRSVHVVRSILMLAALTAGIMAATAASTSARRTLRPTPPTRAQIKHAVTAAERSTSLWATVNICDTKHHPDAIGIRGQMPALGFPAQLAMTVRLRYWSSTRKRFVAVPHFAQRISLGIVTYGTIQGGYEQAFKPPLTLRGSITFRWRYTGRTIGRITKSTSPGHTAVDSADPSGYSAGSCQIAGSSSGQ